MRLRDCVALIKNNRPLQIVAASNLLGFGRGLAVASQGYIAIYMLGGAGKMLQLGLPTAFGTMLGMLLIPLALKKFNVRDTFILFSLFGSAMLTVLFFMGYERIMGGFDFVFYLFLFLVGIRFGNTNITPNLMLADAIDYQEWKTGLRQEGTTYAAIGLFDKIAGALSGAMLNALLVVFAFVLPIELENGDVQEVAQSPATMQGIYALFTIIPAAFGVLSVIPYFFYKLVGKEKDKMVAELAARKAEPDISAAFAVASEGLAEPFDDIY